MPPHAPIRQQRLLLRLAAPACPFQRPAVLRIPSRCASSILTQSLPSPRWPLHTLRHNITFFSTSSSRLQQPPPPPPNQTPFPTYFQDDSIPHTTTPPTQPPISNFPPPPPPPPQQPPHPNAYKRNRRLRRLLFAITCLCIGRISGGVLDRLIDPPPPIEPGSHLDDLQRQQIQHQAAKLDVVQALEADPEWISWDAYTSFPPEQKKQHIVAGTLASSDALGAVQRVFQNTVTGEVLVLVYFGRGVTGWPTVVHGGALATVLDETCGRAAFARLGRFDSQKKNGGSGTEKEGGEKEKPIVTAFLELDYLAMTHERQFYLVGARVRDDEELVAEERGKGHYKAYVEGWVESVRTGEETVVAEALFVRPGSSKKGEDKDKLAAGDKKAVVQQNAKAPLLPPDQRW